MKRAMLLIDIGNTRIKWAMLENGDLQQQQAVAHAAWTAEECDVAFSALPRSNRVLVSNVGGERIGAIVRDVAIARLGVEPEFIHSTTEAAGVRNSYAEPWKLGVDRWLAMIAAHVAYRRAVCVVSIGTAATIDAIDATGQHLGGLIVPGPNLMVDSLLENTSEIGRRTENGSVGFGVFANNTLGAIQQGALHALAALAERAVESMQVQLGVQPDLVLTGGASADVGRLLRFPHTVVADLVLRGLAAISNENGDGRACVPSSAKAGEGQEGGGS
jgi:type III pantothenate kinase